MEKLFIRRVLMFVALIAGFVLMLCGGLLGSWVWVAVGLVFVVLSMAIASGNVETIPRRFQTRNQNSN